jgi:hypothetical protein
MKFHSGEIAVQNRAGVSEEAARLEGLIGNTLKPAAEAFLTTQDYLTIAGTIDAEEKIWASLLTGDSDSVEILSPQIVRIHSLPIFSDPLNQNLPIHPQIGILTIDLKNRRRLRLNGQAQLQVNDKLAEGVRTGMITVQLQEVFFNCLKYIQNRHLTATKQESTNAPETFTRTALNESDRQWIETADTFFIASGYDKTGIDASHRGGFPGFVQVLNSNKLVFPDYEGNNMFQTLGNLAVNPRTGLLFIDFDRGHTLQLTGTATVIWEQEQFAQILGAQRQVEFTIEQILETRNATPLRWKFGEYSPAIPSAK